MTQPKPASLIDRLRDFIDSLFAPELKPVPVPVRIRRDDPRPQRRDSW